MGRFLTRDTWNGDANRPLSFNRWGYGYGNPVKYTDPSGNIPTHCFQFHIGFWPSVSGCADEFDKLFGLDIYDASRAWSAIDKTAVRQAAYLVGSKLSETMPGSTTPFTAFKKVYGIRESRPMQFSFWGDGSDGCYECRPGDCQTADIWEDRTFVDEESGKLVYKKIPGTKTDCACKPKGGYTSSERSIKFASLWPNFTGSGAYWQNIRKINNVIHELGHSFNQRADQPSLKVSAYSEQVTVNGQTELFEMNKRYGSDKQIGFYMESSINGTMTWVQSTQDATTGEASPGSEVFADMFLGWVHDKWALDPYGEARARFMNTNMPGWVSISGAKP